jgi:hypothetical protein
VTRPVRQDGQVLVFLVGLVVLVLGAVGARVGKGLVPKRPLQRTRERLTEDVMLARERLQ